ncbi:MAG: DUF1854 domain-containing protein [Armatimonadota bacterium]
MAATPTPILDPKFDLVFLDPTTVRCFRTGGDALRATISDPVLGPERSWLRVQVARAFPLRAPEGHIGLRDGKDADIGMLRSLEGLDPQSRALIEEEMERRYFLPRVTRVRSVRREFETITWEVDTDRGPRTFHVQNLREAVLDLGNGRVVITDRSGNRVEFPDVRRADRETRSVLERVAS